MASAASLFLCKYLSFALPISSFVFWLLAAVIVTSALGAVLMRNVVHAALSLVITALGTLAAVSTVKDRAHLPLRDA